jgi:WhiB family transcriptional regulator, redox-sensing transcriptional regulator
VLQTIDRPTSHRRPGLPPTGAMASTDSSLSGPAPRRSRPVMAPAPVRRPLPCRVEDPELWFAESPAQLELAKSFCADCPVRDACLAGALDRAEPWGVWGGEIFERGAVIARKRPRGRPRKDAAA